MTRSRSKPRSKRDAKDADASLEPVRKAATLFLDAIALGTGRLRALTAKLEEDLAVLRAAAERERALIDQARDALVAAIGTAEEDGWTTGDLQEVAEDMSTPETDDLAGVDQALEDDWATVLDALEESRDELMAALDEL
jgi:hypothetical protein